MQNESGPSFDSSDIKLFGKKTMKYLKLDLTISLFIVAVFHTDFLSLYHYISYFLFFIGDCIVSMIQFILKDETMLLR